MPTASAVVADMIDTAVGRTGLTFRTLELWSEGVSRMDMAQPGQLKGCFYLRFNAKDEPGVLGKIASILGNYSVSIAAVYQHNSDILDDGSVPVVIMTQQAFESSANQAVAEIDKLDCVVSATERLRILE